MVMSPHHIGSYLSAMDDAAGPRERPDRYVIRLEGRLDPRWATRFDGMALVPQGDGTTLLEGRVPDQAALHGLLRTLRDLGLPLISLARVHHIAPPTHLAEGD